MSTSSPASTASTSSGKSRPSTDASSSTRWHRSDSWREPSQHGLAHVAGDQQSVGIDRVVEPPFGREQPGGLTHVQRIAVGHLAHSGNELWRGTDAGRRTDHLRHALRIQTTESQPRRVAITDELREDVGEPVAGDVDVAVGRDDEQTHLVEVTREELKQQQRRWVRDVDVVEHRDHRRVDRRQPAEAKDRVVETEPRGVGTEARVGRGRRERGHDLSEVVRWSRPAGARRSSGAESIDQRREHLCPRPVRGSTTRLPAPTPADLGTRVARSVRQLCGQARLADAGIAGHEEQASAARPRVRQGSVESRTLRIPPHEGIADHGEILRQTGREDTRCRAPARMASVAGVAGKASSVVHGGVDLCPGCRRRSRDAAVRADDPERLLELDSLDWATEEVAELAAGGRVVRQGEEHGQGVDAFEEVVPGRLAELGFARGEVEDVVDDLERRAEPQAVGRRRIDEIAVVPGDQRPDAGRSREERRRLALDRGVVVVLGAVDLERRLELADLALAQAADRRGEEACDLGAEARRDLGSLREQEVAREDRLQVAPARVHALDRATGRRFVDDVVVVQRSQVHELDRRASHDRIVRRRRRVC